MTEKDGASNSKGIFEMTETEGDIFAEPENAILLHAVNCQGMWGSGIAAAFKSKYPAAFKVYNAYCKENENLDGTCLLIPPQVSDYSTSTQHDHRSQSRSKRRKVSSKPTWGKHWIGCLFTSKGYGKPTKYKPGKDKPEKILENTRKALEDLKKQVVEMDQETVGENGEVDEVEKVETGDQAVSKDQAKQQNKQQIPGPLYACKFNSGSFGVEWEDTRKLIEEAFQGSARVIHVISPP